MKEPIDLKTIIDWHLHAYNFCICRVSEREQKKWNQNYSSIEQLDLASRQQSMSLLKITKAKLSQDFPFNFFNLHDDAKKIVLNWFYINFNAQFDYHPWFWFFFSAQWCARKLDDEKKKN